MVARKCSLKYVDVKKDIPVFLAAFMSGEDMAEKWKVGRATAYKWIKKYRDELQISQKKTNSIALNILEGKKRIVEETVQNFMKTVQEAKQNQKLLTPTQLADMAAKTMSVYNEFEKTANRFGFIEPETVKQEMGGLPTKIEVHIPEDIRQKAEDQLKLHSSEHNTKEDTE